MNSPGVHANPFENRIDAERRPAEGLKELRLEPPAAVIGLARGALQ